ncbi:helix-turn-helix transcriptional regulator [Kutzneria sp. 744]|uniref:helix-turn-helix domain-containing protein n=1 Tax=Kutzneria sp. (strain 744) TaxID=345341 RepID=UPI001E33FEC6|nr:helix-turn-helix transcriptional regulator [Kutzneria sp. 744]
MARLAADGRTNRDIAQALFLTTRTVEAHLTASYRKLAIRGRAQLSAAIAEPPA